MAFAAGESSENSADTKVIEEGGGAGAPDARADSPAACREDHGEVDCPLAAHGGPQWSRSPSAARGGPRAGAGGCTRRRL